MSANKLHFVGIGGAGMSALARVLHSRGVTTTGSDRSGSSTLSALETELGVELFVGHRATNIGHPDRVVASAAIKSDNPELVEASRLGIPIISRATLLGEVMDCFPNRIAVSGTHGKTTTSAMIALMLEHAGVDPTALIGADVPVWSSNTRVGKSNTIVAEACEAYGSFLELRPTHSVITNIEADHLDYYQTFDAVISAFNQFVEQTENRVIICADDGSDRYINDRTKLLTYGIHQGELKATPISDSDSEVSLNGKLLGNLNLIVPGRHNTLNALASVGIGLAFDLTWSAISEGLGQFQGTSRRFEMLANDHDGMTIIDDYAHHPTELRATLAAARARFPEHRIVAIFQPHLPSRTRDLMDEFSNAFVDADVVLISDIYLAREEPIPSISSEGLVAKAEQVHSGNVQYSGNLDDTADLLKRIIKRGDLVITLGAGSIRQVAEEILAKQNNFILGGTF